MAFALPLFAHLFDRAPDLRPTTPRNRPAQRPLRVVRLVEGRASCCDAGRMVISGRMADVCAELDRLAALETRH